MNPSNVGRPPPNAQHWDMNERRVTEGNPPDPTDHVTQQMQQLQVDPAYSFTPREEQQYQPFGQAFTHYPQQYAPQYQPYTYSAYPEPAWRPPRSAQPSPNPASPYGLWSSPPMSPAMAPAPFPAQHSRHGSFDEYGQMQGGRFYNTAYSGSTWTSPTAPSNYAFYTPYQQQIPTMETPSSPALYRNRMSWSGPSRKEGSPEKERKMYHPQAPVRRSDWVMWVGNVPNNTTHEELWRYFNNTVPVTNTDIDAEPWRGPSSIFLISRSSCAFVNLSSQTDLDRAVFFFNGRPLRPWDARCPRMVCRVRAKDDDLRAGVGAQRGTGMHREWVKEHAKSSPPVQSPGSIPPSPAILEHPPEGEGRRRDSIGKAGHESSGSWASTNSSFLTKHFPRRVFILKSNTTAELEDSVKTSLWKTQRHNEPILDQAFRTSQEVFLIFSANKSGEFFGYAKMTEPIDKERAKKAHWSSGSGPKTSASDSRPAYFLSPSLARVTNSSPGELTPNDDAKMEHAAGERKTDPSDLRNKLPDSKSIQSAPEAYRSHTLDPKALQEKSYFPPVPVAAATDNEDNAQRQQSLGGSARPQELDDQGILRKDTVLSQEEKEQREREQEAKDAFAEDAWGHAFRIEWVKVAPLPFYRTRHLRNPWNSDREVKVSRDGTEIEPTVGTQFMAEWDKT